MDVEISAKIKQPAKNFTITSKIKQTENSKQKKKLFFVYDFKTLFFPEHLHIEAAENKRS